MNSEALLAKLHAATKDAKEVVYSVNRMGYTIDGKLYRRVTSMLGGGIPKPALVGWGIKSVANYAWDNIEAWSKLSKTDAIKLLKGSPYSQRDDAAARGTAVHKTLEALLGSTPMPQDLTEDEQACADAAADFLAQRDSMHLGTEITVFNDSLGRGYAGTLDLWEIDRDGQTWILDYKTSKSGVFADMAIQQVAYQRAEFALVNARSIPGDKSVAKVIPWSVECAERLGIVHVTPEGATLHPIRDPESLVPILESAARISQWLADTNSYRKTPRERVYDEPITLQGVD
jgi:hypothetical protein